LKIQQLVGLVESNVSLNAICSHIYNMTTLRCCKHKSISSW